ncbi:MAG: BatA domain-containing protein [Bacteroidales bacterium]|jgi:hypothetical protein|nr:BatA domain-containing protein [Bacteroidales bacterium]
MNRIIAVICLVFISFLGYSQEVNVSAKLDTNAMLIGDHVGITLKYTGPVKAQVLWPFLPDTILGNITVIGRGKIDTAFTTDKKAFTLTQQLNLTCYDSGFYTIPEISFLYRNLPDTTRQTASTEMLLLAVHTIKVDTTQAIKPIKSPLKVPITFREMLPWILGALAIIALIAVVLWYIRKRKRHEPVFQLKPRIKLLPHELAIQELEKLRVKKLWQEGKVKEYHSELTEILRKYVENHYNIPALELTSAELTENLLNDTGCPRQALDKLGDILILADLVKFAKAKPLPSENEVSLNEGIAFVYATTGTPALPEERPVIRDGR